MTVVWNVASMQRDLPDGDTPPEGLVTQCIGRHDSLKHLAMAV